MSIKVERFRLDVYTHEVTGQEACADIDITSKYNSTYRWSVTLSHGGVLASTLHITDSQLDWSEILKPFPSIIMKLYRPYASQIAEGLGISPLRIRALLDSLIEGYDKTL